MSSEKILTAEDIAFIKSKISEIRISKKITNTIIKEEIFRLLESESVVLYYPINDEKACAFYRTKLGHNEEAVKFTFINTQIPFNKQIFAAAHELAHIWGVANHLDGEMLYASSINEYTETLNLGIVSDSKSEEIANRFAAELLVPENTLIDELDKIKDEKEEISINHIIDLMDIFVVPFKTIVLRLHEVGKLAKGARYIKLLSTDTKSDGNEVKKLQKINGKCLKNSESTKVKNMPNYIQTAIDLYLANYKTAAKLKSQLNLFDLTLEELNLVKEKESFPTEEELEGLMADEDENI